jgi:hypothetical protein
MKHKDDALLVRARIVARAGFDEFLRLNGDIDDVDSVGAAKAACSDALLAIPKMDGYGSFLLTDEQIMDIARKAVRQSLSYRNN